MEQVKNTKELPARIENRLKELKAMKEFDDKEVEYCRRTYWEDRDGWHTILINCYERAQQRRLA